MPQIMVGGKSSVSKCSDGTLDPNPTCGWFKTANNTKLP
jgi:hypothetical protein